MLETERSRAIRAIRRDVNPFEISRRVEKAIILGEVGETGGSTDTNLGAMETIRGVWRERERRNYLENTPPDTAMADEELPAGWEKRLSRSTGTLSRNQDHDFCDSSSLNFVTGKITRPVHSPAFFRWYDQSEGKTLFEISTAEFSHHFCTSYRWTFEDEKRSDAMPRTRFLELLFRRKTSRHANIYLKKRRICFTKVIYWSAGNFGLWNI